MQFVQNVLLLSFQLILKIDLFCVHLVPLKVQLCQLHTMSTFGTAQVKSSKHTCFVYMPAANTSPGEQLALLAAIHKLLPQEIEMILLVRLAFFCS